MTTRYDLYQRIVCAGGQWNAYPILGVSRIDVVHGADCWLHRRGRTCTCVPGITVTAPTGVFEIAPDGRPRKVEGGRK